MEKTQHRLLFQDSCSMAGIADEEVDLIVTSPPYPMIAMWDGLFCSGDPVLSAQLSEGRTDDAFEKMHGKMDPVWEECRRVLKTGGFLCVNIGDAVRSFQGNFRLFPNHVRILSKLMSLGFDMLPSILWRKPTNSPTKFMGSGMLPGGAYVTLEHEYILILRKRGRRRFLSEEGKAIRRQSACFWEERNVWYSDIWTFKGARQELSAPELRERSAAFPFELAARLIQMYSVRGDTVLDPFLGTGTTMLAAAAGCRNSIGIELDTRFRQTVISRFICSEEMLNAYTRDRIQAHEAFIREYDFRKKTAVKYRSRRYGFPVVTRQEQDIRFSLIDAVSADGDTLLVSYRELDAETCLPVEKSDNCRGQTAASGGSGTGDNS